MKITELSQMVKLDQDGEKMVEQSFTFDPNDNWVHIFHDGNEISLSLENWNNLKMLGDKVLNKKPENP